jgi:tRNA(Ile)-lysidine synthase
LIQKFQNCLEFYNIVKISHLFNNTNIDIKLLKVSNIEENARKIRYHSLSCNLEKNEILCTAHHQNDQAETLLLQLFRGCGVAGLAAMPKSKPFGKGTHYRPMLNIGKSVILKYAKNNHLSWVEDDSNMNKKFRRNFLRLTIIPKLEAVYKNLTLTLLRSACMTLSDGVRKLNTLK